jgi:hypothetical protein
VARSRLAIAFSTAASRGIAGSGEIDRVVYGEAHALSLGSDAGEMENRRGGVGSAAGKEACSCVNHRCETEKEKEESGKKILRKRINNVIRERGSSRVSYVGPPGDALSVVTVATVTRKRADLHFYSG